MEYAQHKENIVRSVSVNDANVEDFQESLHYMLQHHTIKEINTWKTGGEGIYTQDFLLHTCLKHRRSTPSTISIALCLIRAGIDVNVENILGSTPMELAVKYVGDISVINAMLEHGANVHNLVHDLSYLDMALELGRYEVCELLLNAGFNINAANTNCISYGQYMPYSVKHLEEALVSANALFYAIYKGNPEQIQFLLDHGANPNATALRLFNPSEHNYTSGFYHWSIRVRECTVTPLYLSVLLQKREATERLLRAGANPNFTSNSGESLFGLLDLNIKKNFRPSVDVSAFSLLFDYGLQMSIKRKNYEDSRENYNNRGGDYVFEAHADTSDTHNISRLIRKKIKEQKRQALAMALHDRLGANAPLSALGADMIRHIGLMDAN